MSRISKVSTESEVKLVTESVVRETIKANTVNSPKGIHFVSPHNNSRFVFHNGKEKTFVNRVLTTEDETEIAELRAAAKSSFGMIQEVKEEKEEPEVKEEKTPQVNPLKPNVK